MEMFAPSNVITRHRSLTPAVGATLYPDFSLHRLAQLCPEQAPLLGQSCALRFAPTSCGPYGVFSAPTRCRSPETIRPWWLRRYLSNLSFKRIFSFWPI